MRANPAVHGAARRRRWAGRSALAGSGWLVLGLTALPAGSALRAGVVFLFLLSCPGAALVRHWPGHDGLERSVLAVGVSMALTMVVAETLVVTRTWSVPVALAALALITSIGALLPAPSSPRRPRSAP